VQQKQLRPISSATPRVRGAPTHARGLAATAEAADRRRAGWSRPASPDRCQAVAPLLESALAQARYQVDAGDRRGGDGHRRRGRARVGRDDAAAAAMVTAAELVIVLP